MKEMLPKIIVILGICIIFIICAFLFVRLYFSIKLENKLKKFTVNVSENNTISFVDRLMIFFLKIIKKISKLNSKSVILKKYSVRLSKYLIYNKSNNLKSIDYISIKILYMIFIDFLYIIMSILKGVKTDLSLFIILSFVSFFMIDIILIIIYKKKRNTIESGLLQAIVIMNSAFKSGKNIWQAINIVKTSTESPIKEEFEIISKDIDYGLDLLTVFERFYNRVKVEEVKYITSSLSLLNKTGGNIVSVFNMIEKHFYDKLKIKNELNSLTSSSKMLYRILVVIPFVFIIVITMLNKDYFKVLITTKIGIIIDFFILLIYIIYIITIKKITKVEKV